jgi:ribosomal protein S18 acetylase RimI-like enzyme
VPIAEIAEGATLPAASRIARTSGARRGEVRRLVRLLRGGFEEEPVQRWLYPSRAWRVVASELWFHAMLADALRAGEVWRFDDFSSVAVWLAPGDRSKGSGPWAAILKALEAVNRRAAAIRSELDEELERRRPPARHWYLAAVSTERGRRGEGRGRDVLAPVLARCEQEGRLAYLETSEPRSIAFYERLGFEVWSRFELTAGPTVWTMGRQPGREAG